MYSWYTTTARVHPPYRKSYRMQSNFHFNQQILHPCVLLYGRIVLSIDCCTYCIVIIPPQRTPTPILLYSIYLHTFLDCSIQPIAPLCNTQLSTIILSLQLSYYITYITMLYTINHLKPTYYITKITVLYNINYPQRSYKTIYPNP